MKGVIIFFFLSLLFASEIIYATTTVWRSDNEVMSLFEKWLVKHGKVYNALGEKAMRFEIFKNNLRYIDEHDKNFPNKTYTLGLNVFADLTDDEYQSWYLGTRIDPQEMFSTFHDDSDEYLDQDELENLPNSVDWRSKGYVLPIRNQGKCGSCWAFSAISSVEMLLAMRTGRLISLSEQELVDCDAQNKGCIGGFYHLAFGYITINGSSSRQSYPYIGRSVAQCRLEPKVARIDGYNPIVPYNERALQAGVARQVISVTIKSTSTDIKLYSHGIFQGQCGDRLDHAVTIVGYGSENGVDYWIVRNSWGTNWGESGYMRIKRNTPYRESYCGIASMPYYPVKRSAYNEVEYKSSF